MAPPPLAAMAYGALSMFLLLVLLLLMSTGYVDGLGGYRLQSLGQNNEGNIVANLEIASPSSTYGPDLKGLQLTVSYPSEDSIRVHITDATSTRWEIPNNLIPRQQQPQNISIPNHPLEFSCTVEPFTFAVVRKSTREALFNSTSDLAFKDQYLEISTAIPTYASLYGLGESTRPSGFRLEPNSTYSLWASDTPSRETNKNLYASWPFYLDVREGGVSHGVLLLNSNGMDVVYQAGSLTYKSLGGVFDFYFFAGPSPLSVVQQLTDFVGKPAPMPYWSLGFHQCRYGYKNVEELQSVVENYRAANIPLEVMWTDIDYMDAFKDFTLDPVNFPATKMQAFVERLHADGQKYVMILDPGIKIESNYSSYERGTSMDIFIKDSSGNPYVGQVWPGPVHFLDFLHPTTVSYWTSEISDFHKILPFDGVWIDMNEVSNFCSGITCSVPTNAACPSPDAFTTCCLVCSDKAPSIWDNPAYLINNNAVRNQIGFKTMAASAVHHGGILEYNAHNLYGLSEAVATNQALKSVTGKRPFILSRSTFVGSGRVTAHWSGDNGASWEDLRYSIVSILNSGMVGIPMIGADICGFLGNTTEELCNRWIQLGAFYPFSRNHNDVQSLPQELYLWKSVTESARKALSLRYRLLPHLYTLFYKAHIEGSPVARPIFFAFPEDQKALGVDSQFMLGDSILVSPVLHENATSVDAYFPKGTWYSLFNCSEVISSSGLSYVLPAPSDSPYVHLRGGSIIPMQQEAMTTAMARKTPFILLVAFSDVDDEDGSQSAAGELFLDNDDNPDMVLKEGHSTLVQFTAKMVGHRVSIKSHVTFGAFALQQGWHVSKVVVLGLNRSAHDEQQELVDGRALLPQSSFKTPSGYQDFSELNLPLGKPFHIKLKMATYQ